ncbi:hypothetical protein LTR17_004858 [Elasticomyces elasticus]|nr:hypothetical protein LTR17_004858 [Elasticomyces elasticus]
MGLRQFFFLLNFFVGQDNNFHRTSDLRRNHVDIICKDIVNNSHRTSDLRRNYVDIFFCEDILNLGATLNLWSEQFDSLLSYRTSDLRRQQLHGILELRKELLLARTINVRTKYHLFVLGDNS